MEQPDAKIRLFGKQMNRTDPGGVEGNWKASTSSQVSQSALTPWQKDKSKTNCKTDLRQRHNQLSRLWRLAARMCF